MSARKKNTRTTPRPATGTTPAPTAPADGVPMLSTDNEKNLWAALDTYPGSTVAELADHAGVSASTARRILSDWATAGAARRYRDPDKPRAAERWTPTTTDPADATDPADVSEDDVEALPEGEDPSATTELAQDSADESDPVPDSGDATGTDQPAPVVPGPQTAAEPAPAGRVDGETATPATGAGTAGADAADADASVSVPLAPGALRGMVEDFLIEHPEGEFTPHEIGKSLGRSSGAVLNALVKLATLGTARRTSDQPKRFALAATS